MRQIEYVKYNKLRKPQFQIRTVICLDTDTGRRYVEKSAVRACGQAHISAFPRHAGAIDACFRNVEALKPELSEGVMRYAYLEGRNFDDLLSEQLRTETDPVAAVGRAMERIFAVKPGGLVPFAVTPAFVETFGQEAADKIGEMTDNPQAFAVSNIDMIFENIMVTNDEVCGDHGSGYAAEAYEQTVETYGRTAEADSQTAEAYVPTAKEYGDILRSDSHSPKLYCLDYEWVLDFPVPAQFIRYRNLHYFYRKFGSFLSAFCPRREFLERLGIDREQAELFAGMEASFQEYVHGRKEAYAYTKRYEKQVKTFREIMEEQERTRQQFAHQIEDYKLAVQLKENHIQNLNVMIADRDAMLEKYAPFKKAAKMMGGKAVYKGLKSLYKEASAAGNAAFPEGSERRRLLNGSKNVLLHPEQSGKLLAAKKGRLSAGDEELDRLYYELGGLEFPVYRKPLVSIIIPAYNQVGYTYRCLASVLENTRDVAYEVILADDKSTDGTKVLSMYCKGITIVRNKENLGFLKNCNHGAESARGKYIFFLNNDTQVKPGWLSSLVKLMESDSSIGMAGSKLVYPDGRLQEAGGIFWREGNGWNYGKFDDPDKPEYNYVKDVDYISGAAIMLSKSLWQRLGGFDERFAPAYCEDADLAFAVRAAGYRVVYQPLSVVVHYEGISNGTDTGSGVKAYQVANMEKLKEKWADAFAKQEVHGERPNPFAARERLGNRKVILAIDHYVPTFDKDAGSKSTFQYLKLFLRKGYVVKFVGDNYGHEEPYTTVFQQMGIEVLYGRWYEENILSWIEENQKYIQFAYINRPHIAIKYMDFIRKKTDIKIMYYGHDLHFLRELREFEVTGDPAHKKESEYMKKQELALIRTADMSYYPSCVERDVLREIDDSLRVKAVCLNMFESFKEDIDFDFTKRRGLMFVGGFAHHPNKDAVMWFVEEIWPLIRRQTELPFYIVGSKAPEEVLALDGRDGIVVKGFVTDEELEELYGSCQAVVVPLRFGAGVKGKVIESLYYGMPTVTTSIGAEGIEGAQEVLAVADTAEEFARKTLAYCRDPELSARTGRDAVEYVKNTFGMEAVWEIVKEDFQ